MYFINSKYNFMPLAKCLRIKVISRGLHMRAMSTKLGMSNSSFNTECTGRYRGFIVFVRGRYTDGAFLQGAFFRSFRLSWSCRKRVLLKHPSARAATFHIAWPRRKSYRRTTCYARHIRCKSTSPKARLLGVEVPNELPLKSNSRFLAKATARASVASEPANASIGKFNERKSLLEMFDIYWLLTNNWFEM